MFNKIVNAQSKSITSAAVLIGALSLISRFVGIFRDHILAAQFGAGNVLDAYYAAFRLPDLVYNLLILGAVSAGLIPIFTTLLSENKKEDAWKLINNILNLLSIGLAVICLVLFLSAGWLMPLITPGFPPEKMELVIGLSRIMFLSPILLGLSAIFSSILQSFRKFFMYSLAPIFYNIGIIIGAIYFTKIWGVYGLAWGVVFGAAMHMILQLMPIFFVGYKYRPTFAWRDKYVMRVARMMIPRVLALTMSQINFVIITVFASAMTAGSLAIFNLSNNLQNFPLGIFGVSLAVAALPVLSMIVAEHRMDDFVKTLSATMRQILFFLLPLSALFYVLRAQIVRVLLGSGSFDWQDTRLTAACLAIFCLGLFAQGVYPLIIRGFYALHNTKTPFYIGIATMIINLASLLVFRWLFSFQNWFSFGVAAFLKIPDMWASADLRVLALPAAITVSSIFDLLALVIYLRQKIGRLDGRKIVDSVFRITVASVGSGLCAYGILQIAPNFVETDHFVGIFLQGLAAGLVGLVGYLVLGLLLRMEEMHVFVQSLKRKMWRLVKLEKVELPSGDADVT